MVMDAQPSPQSVGREFVRQYYTLLNKAPNHLHRFYNNNSSFIHGGLDSHNREATIVVGQKNIHNKIQQLNFRDCHAKISQVDAQATLGNGVVVQVTGELSNDGQPMRRFTQTFVLAAQSPKNYYVHNDIFRYQDLYSDDENDGESRSENDEEPDVEIKTTDNTPPNSLSQGQVYYTLPPVSVALSVVPPLQIQSFNSQSPQVNGVVHDEILQSIQSNQATPVLPPPIQQTQPTSTIHSIQGVALPTTPVPNNIALSIESESSAETIQSNAQDVVSISPTLNEAPIKDEIDQKKEEFSSALEENEKSDVLKSSQNEPKTYANLFKSMSTASNNGFSSQIQGNQQNNSINSMSKQSDQRSDNSQSTGLPQRGNSVRQNKDFLERRTSNSNSQFGDSHQLFLGNIPHHATEEELKILFSKFGVVIDLRIHSKSISKMTNVRQPPNYGFITYDNPESVQNCLANCPLYFPDNSPDGQKLNIEEKKTRLRNSNDIPRSSQNNISGGMGNSQRSSGGSNRSLSNSGGMIRGISGNNGSTRNTSGPMRSVGNFSRNDRGPNGSLNRGNSSSSNSTGTNYGRR